MKSTLLAVVGMHRSGTSATAGAFSHLGIDFGPASLLMPASSDNPKGYFEAKPVVRIHDRLLRDLGGSWNDPQIRGDWLLTMQAGIAERLICEWLRQLPKDKINGVKDPRMSLFYPLWARACEAEGVRLVPCCVIRDLGAVVRSLQRRDDFDSMHSCKMAEKYGIGVFKWSQHAGAATVHFKDLINDPIGALQPTLDSLSFNPDNEDWQRAFDFLDPELVHD